MYLFCRYLTFALVTFVSSHLQAATEIYEWRDSQGGLHFSDKPRDGAKTLEIEDPQTYTNKSPTADDSASTGASSDNVDALPADYQITITSPKNEQTIRNTGDITVSLSLTPRLRDGDKVQLYFDGKPAAEPQPVNVFQLKNVPRGTHKMYATVVDAKGREVGKSSVVQIFVHRHFIRS